MDQQESEHWWFKARREIIRETISRLIDLPEKPIILEAGCGTGGNLDTLMEFGKVEAFEFDEDAREISVLKSGLPVAYGALPDEVPFEDCAYDLIGLFDVLEHVEEDKSSLAALGRKLSDEGVIFVTVPAFQWLWSKHDETHHHFRRYSKSSLSKTAHCAGLEVVSCNYFNSLLLPVAILMRAAKKLIGSDAPDDTMPSGSLNKALYTVFSAERHLLGRIPMPAGLSVMAILRKPKT
jgi:SAM-dependent methyltransferase